MRKIWALVPLKLLANAKQRLRSVLDETLCKALVTAMIKDVLSVIDSVDSIERILLVTSEPDSEQFILSDKIEIYSDDIGAGLNEDLENATTYAHSKGANEVFIVHGDLPLISKQSVTEVINGKIEDEIRLVGCKINTGTNALLTCLPLNTPLVFGENSLAKFHQSAHSSGKNIRVFKSPDLKLDIDDPADLEQLISVLKTETFIEGETKTHLNEYSRQIVRMIQETRIPAAEAAN